MTTTNDQHGKADKPIDIGAQLLPDLHHPGFMFDYHENKGRVCNLGGDEGIAHDKRFPKIIFSHGDVRSQGIGRHRQGHLLKDFAVVFGRCLDDAGPVDEKDFRMRAGFVGSQGLYQPIRIERGPQDEKRAVGTEGLDRNDDVRNITISAKNFADIKMVFLAFNKPALIAVVPALEVERSGIRRLVTRMGNHA